MTREEHIAWARERALAYLEEPGDATAPGDAISSMLSDLLKYDGFTTHERIQIIANGSDVIRRIFAGEDDIDDMRANARKWIEGVL